MRWAAPVVGIGLLALVLSLFFAWQKSPIERGWDPDRLVVDASRVHDRDEANRTTPLAAPYWMEQLIKSGDQPRLPADELFVSWDLVPAEFRQSLVLKLIFEDLNRFEKRCLQAFLKEQSVRHTWQEDPQRVALRLESKEPDYAHGLLDQLATYDLIGHLRVLQETKPY